MHDVLIKLKQSHRDPENNYVTCKQKNHLVEAVVGKHFLVELWCMRLGR